MASSVLKSHFIFYLFVLIGYKDTNAESESRARNLQDEIQDIEDDDDEVTGGIVNWAGVLSTPIKNQGYCGSCW